MRKSKVFLFFTMIICNIYAYSIPDNELVFIDMTSYIGSYKDSFMRTSDNDIVFVSATEYLNINSMTINTLILPEDIDGQSARYLRPPFSNNKILVTTGLNSNSLYLYDIFNQTTSLINDVSLYSLLPDSDRNFVIFLMSTSEWWLGCLNWGETLWLIRKDGNPLRRSENIDPLEFLLSEFDETIFNNDFIIKTIRNINETRENLIARDQVIFFSGRESDGNGDNIVQSYLGNSNAFYYFVNRMSTYFNIDIQSIFGFMDRGFGSLRNSIGIYENGFFIIEDVKFMLLDVRNNETRYYIINEAQYVPQEDYAWGSDDIEFEVFITNDSRTLLLRKLNSRTGESVIFKYEL